MSLTNTQRFSITAAARLLSCDKEQLRYAVTRGLIPHVNVGRVRHIRLCDASAWLEQLPVFGYVENTTANDPIYNNADTGAVIERLERLERAIEVLRAQLSRTEPRTPRKQVGYPTREIVKMRDGNRCRYCGKRVTVSTRHFDHIIPYSAGGNNTVENIVVACVLCNRIKGAHTPEQAGMVLLPCPTEQTP